MLWGQECSMPEGKVNVTKWSETGETPIAQRSIHTFFISFLDVDIDTLQVYSIFFQICHMSDWLLLFEHVYYFSYWWEIVQHSSSYCAYVTIAVILLLFLIWSRLYVCNIRTFWIENNNITGIITGLSNQSPDELRNMSWPACNRTLDTLPVAQLVLKELGKRFLIPGPRSSKPNVHCFSRSNWSLNMDIGNLKIMKVTFWSCQACMFNCVSVPLADGLNVIPTNPASWCQATCQLQSRPRWNRSLS